MAKKYYPHIKNIKNTIENYICLVLFYYDLFNGKNNEYYK